MTHRERLENKIKCIAHYLKGGTILARYSGEWSEIDPSRDLEFNNSGEIYKIKENAEPSIFPQIPEVPFFFIRHKFIGPNTNPTIELITRYSPAEGVFTKSNGQHYDAERAETNLVWSVDRINWKTFKGLPYDL